MIYRTGETIECWAFYTVSGVGATGLTVTATIYDSTGEIATPAVSEIAGGLYRCTYTPASDGAYICIFATADDTVDQQEIGAIVFRGTAGVNNLDQSISTTESNIRGSDSDDIKVISDQLDVAQADLDNPNQYKADVSNLDAAVSSRSSHGVSDIWEYETRTLTDLGIEVVANVWSYDTRTLTQYGNYATMIATGVTRKLIVDGQYSEEITLNANSVNDVIIILIDAGTKEPVDLSNFVANGMYIVVRENMNSEADFVLPEKELSIDEPLEGIVSVHYEQLEMQVNPGVYFAEIYGINDAGDTYTLHMFKIRVLSTLH